MPPRSGPDQAIGECIRTRRLSRGWSVRYAASRGGVSHATWSRIERGRQTANNRFVLAAIAAALECPLTDLTGTPAPIADRDVMSAQACVPAIRQALVELDLPDRATQLARPPADLLRAATLVRHLWQKCDYAGASRLLPDLVRALHATRPHDPAVLRLRCDIAGVASSMLRSVGHPADSWLAAERCRTAAEATDDPVLLGYAAFTQAMAARACGSETRCLTIAERAADDLQSHLDRSGAMDVLGMLHLVCAAAANRLDRPDDTATSIAQAADIAGRTSDTGFFGMHFGPPNVRFWQIGIDADNGDPGHAIARAQSINPTVINAPQRHAGSAKDSDSPDCHQPHGNHPSRDHVRGHATGRARRVLKACDGRCLRDIASFVSFPVRRRPASYR